MQAWLKKKLGITPELIERVESAERAATERSRSLPYVVNRQVLVLLPLEKYFLWKNHWDSMRKGVPPRMEPSQERWSNARAYLVSGIDDDAKLDKLVRTYRKYFLNSFVEGHAPKSLWPWVPTEEEFPEWFEVRLVGWGAWDLDMDTLGKEPDILTAVGPEL